MSTNPSANDLIVYNSGINGAEDPTYISMSNGLNPQNGLLPINPLLEVYMNSVSTLSQGIDVEAQNLLGNITFDEVNKNMKIGIDSLKQVLNAGPSYGNIGIGHSSMYNATDDTLTQNNIGLGTDSLYNLDKGSDNIAIGSLALYSGIDICGNVAIGTQSLYSNQRNWIISYR